jgi:hypothetical protein
VSKAPMRGTCEQWVKEVRATGAGGGLAREAEDREPLLQEHATAGGVLAVVQQGCARAAG